jgi:DNA-binding FrmR family transcriptional regulator
MSPSVELIADDVAKRLARIAGHAASLKKMWEDGRECDEILTQISAVRAALDQVGRVILENHIEECVAKAIERGNAEDAVRDLKESVDRLISSA